MFPAANGSRNQLTRSGLRSKNLARISVYVKNPSAL